MTAWRVGMEAVCIAEGVWVTINGGPTGGHDPEKGDVLRVTHVSVGRPGYKSLWKILFAKKRVWLKFAALPNVRYDAAYFRPAQRCSSEIAARIKACRPARKPLEA